MGHSASHSNSSQHSQKSTFNNVDYRKVPAASGGGNTAVGGDTNVNIGGSGQGAQITIKKSDYGAIQTAGDIANHALDTNANVTNDALQTVQQTNQNAMQTVQSTQKTDANLTQQLTSQALGIVEKRAATQQQQLVGSFTKLTALLMAGGVGAVWIYKKG